MHQSSSGLKSLIASWPGLHGKQGVNSVLAQDGTSLWSAGRDGKIRRLSKVDGGVQVFFANIPFQRTDAKINTMPHTCFISKAIFAFDV